MMKLLNSLLHYDDEVFTSTTEYCSSVIVNTLVKMGAVFTLMNIKENHL